MLIGIRNFLTHEDKREGQPREGATDLYFSADVETDGPIPGPYSILSFAMVYAGSFDGRKFKRPENYDRIFYRELKPISDLFQKEALDVNGLDRARLCVEGTAPERAMTEAFHWINANTEGAKPVLVAYPLSFDWTWLYWYFIQFCKAGSPFDYSRCFDIKTALAVKAGIPISEAGRSRLDSSLSSKRQHTHHAVDDAIEQAEIFANIFEWAGVHERAR
jgi:3' exoribonuclease, RNase T-like